MRARRLPNSPAGSSSVLLPNARERNAIIFNGIHRYRYAVEVFNEAVVASSPASSRSNTATECIRLEATEMWTVALDWLAACARRFRVRQKLHSFKILPTGATESDCPLPVGTAHPTAPSKETFKSLQSCPTKPYASFATGMLVATNVLGGIAADGALEETLTGLRHRQGRRGALFIHNHAIIYVSATGTGPHNNSPRRRDGTPRIGSRLWPIEKVCLDLARHYDGRLRLRQVIAAPMPRATGSGCVLRLPRPERLSPRRAMPARVVIANGAA